MPAIRAAARSVDDRLPLYTVRSLAGYVDDQVAPTTFGVRIVGAFAVLVLLSVGIGLYGVLTIEVARRTREIGLRLAIGAGRTRVVWSVVRRGLVVVGSGAIVGTVLALALGDVLSRAARGTSRTDPLAWAVAMLAVTVVAVAALWLPAWRASRLTPTEALRSE
jgi:ABC-type antimicrobial peptide transport system permease subunit